VFDTIFQLVKGQIDEVKHVHKDDIKVPSLVNRTDIGKVLFLVGGLGSNSYLCQFLQDKLGPKIDVKQPELAYTFLYFVMLM
jgi:hypothetical protein